MKKVTILLVILFTLLLTSCRYEIKKKSIPEPVRTPAEIERDSLVSLYGNETTAMIQYHDVIIIDSCEYIVFQRRSGYGGYGYMAHKGNCKNPIHEHNDRN